MADTTEYGFPEWEPVKSGPADETGEVAGEFEDGPGRWKQV